MYPSEIWATVNYYSLGHICEMNAGRAVLRCSPNELRDLACGVGVAERRTLFSASLPRSDTVLLKTLANRRGNTHAHIHTLTLALRLLWPKENHPHGHRTARHMLKRFTGQIFSFIKHIQKASVYSVWPALLFLRGVETLSLNNSHIRSASLCEPITHTNARF